jgi:hypothetical protein
MMMKMKKQVESTVNCWLDRLISEVAIPMISALVVVGLWSNAVVHDRNMDDMNQTILIIATLGACTPAGHVVSTVSAVGEACFDPVSYGAIPNDGISDRPAMQAAADAAALASLSSGVQRVCIGAGVWDCSRAPVGSYNRNACVSVHGGAVMFSGVGPATVIRLAGDQDQGDIVVLSHDPDSSGGVQDLTVDTSDAFDTSEQTHAMGTTGVCRPDHCRPITDLSYRRVVCLHPKRAGERKGDCIRLLGNTAPGADGSPGTGIYGVTIEDNVFKKCARSGIQPQRGVHGMVIHQNEFWCDQPVHGEATGGSSPHENVGAEIAGNVFHGAELDGTPFQGDYDIELSGPPGSGPYEGIRIHGNVGTRGIDLYRTSGAEVYETAMFATMRGPRGVIEVGNRCDGLHVRDIVVERRGSDGPLMRLISRSGALCSGVTVENSMLIQATHGSGIYAESVSDLVIDRSLFAWSVPSGPDLSGVYVRGTVSPVTGVVVKSTWFSGPLDVAIRLAGSPEGIGTAHIIGNMARGRGALVCGGAAGLVEYTMNDLGPPSCSAVMVP